MKLTAPDLMEMEIIDKVVPEPPGGAHWDHDKATEILRQHIVKELGRLGKLPVEELLEKRRSKFEKMGYWEE